MRDSGEPFLMPGVVMGLRDPESDVRQALSAEDYEADFAEGRAWSADVAEARAIELAKRGDS